MLFHPQGPPVHRRGAAGARKVWQGQESVRPGMQPGDGRQTSSAKITDRSGSKPGSLFESGKALPPLSCRPILLRWAAAGNSPAPRAMATSPCARFVPLVGRGLAESSWNRIRPTASKSGRAAFCGFSDLRFSDPTPAPIVATPRSAASLASLTASAVGSLHFSLLLSLSAGALIPGRCASTLPGCSRTMGAALPGAPAVLAAERGLGLVKDTPPFLPAAPRGENGAPGAPEHTTARQARAWHRHAALTSPASSSRVVACCEGCAAAEPRFATRRRRRAGRAVFDRPSQVAA